MASLIIMVDGVVWQEIPVSKERMVIGRRAQNDVVIDDPAVSAEHAVIVSVGSDAFLEDLGSTNGTKVNGQPVKKHFLQDGDAVELAKYVIHFNASASHSRGQSSGILNSAVSPAFAVTESGNCSRDISRTNSSHSVTRAAAVIQILTGINAGKQIVLSRSLTTIGRPGEEIAVVNWSSEGYSIMHIEGSKAPLVNGRPIEGAATRLLDRDVITLSGTEMMVLIDETLPEMQG